MSTPDLDQAFVQGGGAAAGGGLGRALDDPVAGGELVPLHGEGPLVEVRFTGVRASPPAGVRNCATARSPSTGVTTCAPGSRTGLCPTGVDAGAVLALADLDDLHTTIERLGVSLAAVNAGFRTLGLPPLHHRDGHVRQFAAHLQQHRAEIQDRLRDRFVAVVRRGEPLTEYLRLRDLPGLDPDPDWLDRHWDLPEPVLNKRIGDWLNAVCPAASPIGPASTALLPQ
ncbi:hypothetical protein ACIBF5_06850 [Micromonospora sp. NPDC050417]|uniref:hypothetical protein n=1 Tax=Micromonospora sp. NPDC050417 TaxID=3364280 RepID=UPI0037ACFD3F